MPVTVQILDKDYRIACAPDEQHGLMDCARLLDRRMREVRQNGRVIGADRIAVMAALNLLYELMQERDRTEVDIDRLANLQQRVSAAVDDDPIRDTGAGEGSAPGGDDAGDAPDGISTTGVDAPDRSV
jgi:cell division protein ZapA